MSAIAKIHVAKRELGLDDAAYRALLARETGKTSAALLTAAEQVRVLSAFERAGFRPKGASKSPRPAHVRKVYALWGALQALGEVAGGRAGAPALRAFVRRQTGAAAPEFLSPENAASVIEALKAWEARVLRERAASRPRSAPGGGR